MSSDYEFLRAATLDKAIDTRLRTEALDRLLLHLGAVTKAGQTLIPTPTYNEVVELVKDKRFPQAGLLLRKVMGIDFPTAKAAVDIIDVEVEAAG